MDKGIEIIRELTAPFPATRSEICYRRAERRGKIPINPDYILQKTSMS